MASLIFSSVLVFYTSEFLSNLILKLHPGMIFLIFLATGLFFWCSILNSKIFLRLFYIKFRYYFFPQGLAIGSFLGLLIGIVNASVCFQLIVAISIIISFFLCLSQKIFSEKNKGVEKKEASEGGGFLGKLLNEEPIDSLENDEIGIEISLKEIKSVLLTTQNKKGKTIALYGKNGSGKTSLLKVLERDSELLRFNFVYFLPYQYSSEREMAKKFYSKLVETIEKKGFYPGLTGIPEKFIRLISGASLGVKTMNLSMEALLSFFQDESIDSLTGRIKDCLAELDLNIVVIIDDLDRCSESKRYFFFQLLSTLKQLDRVSFIVAASVNELLKPSDTTLVSIV